MAVNQAGASARAMRASDSVLSPIANSHIRGIAPLRDLALRAIRQSRRLWALPSAGRITRGLRITSLQRCLTFEIAFQAASVHLNANRKN